jgi:hypothetical protein
MIAPTEREAIARLLELVFIRTSVHCIADRIIAEHIEPLRAALAKAEEKITALETLRPYWAQGYSSDSIAAQTLTTALSKAEHRASALEALLAECATAIRECLQYIDGNPPHKVLPNIDWLCALERSVLAKLKRAVK